MRVTEGEGTDGRTEPLGARTAPSIHDLRGALGALTLQAHLLVERLRCPPIQSIGALQQSAQSILSATARIAALLNELTASIDGDRAALKIEPTMVDMPQLLTDTIELSMPVATARRIALEASGEDGRPLCADAIQLQRVLENMVNNAIEAIGEGPGAVHVRGASLGDGWVRISVQDTGPGLQDGIDVFRPFETTKGGHSGLGLAIASEIVTAHGGRITARPRAPHGTIFEIDLPRSGPSRGKASSDSPA